MPGAPPSWFPHGRGRIRLADNNNDDNEPKDEATELVDVDQHQHQQPRVRRPSATIVSMMSDDAGPATAPRASRYLPQSQPRALGQHPAEAGEVYSMHSTSMPPRRSARFQRALQLERTSSRASSVSLAEEGEAAPLLEDNPPPRWYHGPLFVATVKLSVLFAVFSILVLGTFWFGMPKVEE